MTYLGPSPFELALSHGPQSISREGEMTGWQPIDSAPKTSHAILVHVPDVKCTFAVTWNKGDSKTTPFWQIFGGGWRSSLNEHGGPSHWMPLPEPPNPEEHGE